MCAGCVLGSMAHECVYLLVDLLESLIALWIALPATAPRTPHAMEYAAQFECAQ